MQFVDEAVIQVKAGKGGDGITHFARTRRNPRGGPDGGDGGDGGDVIFIGDSRLWTLLDFKQHSIIVAEDGRAGAPNFKKGRSGRSVRVRVPVGCKIIDLSSNELLGDIIEHGQAVLVAKGGKGGLGNHNFATARNQVPTKSTKGLQGERKRLLLSLEVLAHIGLIGLPNAGKSTLLQAISSSKSKVADYPFTTVYPNLGTVSIGDLKMVVADLPGLISGASEGRGLGLKFLKHASRCMLLCHLIESTLVWRSETEKPRLDEFLAIEDELRKYSALVFKKPRLVVVSKMDLAPKNFSTFAVEDAFSRAGYGRVLFVSAKTGEGIDKLIKEFENDLKLPMMKQVQAQTPRQNLDTCYRKNNHF